MGILHYKDPTTGQWVPLSAAGPTGAQGAVGPVGPAGPKGDPGTPLDEVWVGPEAPTGSSVEVWVDTDEVGSNDVLTRQVADATYVNVAGDTMTGPLVINSTDPEALRVNFNGKEIAFAARDDVGQSGTPPVGAIVRKSPTYEYAQLIVADPVQITHAANKKYVDSKGKWQAYTPTVTGTGFTLGNGTVVARYTRIGNTVHVSFALTLGSGTVMGTQSIIVSAPLAKSSSSTFIGVAALNSAGSNEWLGRVSLGTAFSIGPLAPATLAAANFSPTFPFAWKATDTIRFVATYETDAA
jgi:hypothetical protein